MRVPPLLAVGAVSLASASRLSLDLAGHVPEYCGAALVETGAWLHDQSPQLFWSFIDQLAADDAPSDLKRDEWAYYGAAAKKVLNDKTLSSIMVPTLASRSYSFIAGTFSELYSRVEAPTTDDCRSWLQYGERHLCRAEKIGMLVDRLAEGKVKGGKLEEMVPAFDRYQSRDLTAFPLVILWADPNSTSSWSAMHRALSKQAQVGEITYVLRFIIKRTGCKVEGEKVRMSGYGVSVEMKEEEGEAVAEVGAADEIYRRVGLKKSGLAAYKITTTLPEADLRG